MRDGYRPNWEAECTRCGNSPCVDVIREGRIVNISDLCGACYFRDREKLDPDNWNETEGEET